VRLTVSRSGPHITRPVHRTHTCPEPPYIRRRNGEPWQHTHLLLVGGVGSDAGRAAVQEQVMQMAADVATLATLYDTLATVD
jgi:hypothetical protein